MRVLTLIAAAVIGTTSVVAQEATISAPKASISSYDPQLSAKEAVLANWDLAASGIRAGHVIGSQVLALAETDANYDELVRQAAFAQKTMIQRYNAAQWIFLSGDDLAELHGGTLVDVVKAVQTECESTDCAQEKSNLTAAFRRAAAEMGETAQTARDAVDRRKSGVDAVLMSEQLSTIADYLEGDTWAKDLSLTDFGLDGDVVAARIVGTVALWRNVEPYVGLIDPELDTAINGAARELLRTLRRETRSAASLAEDGPELTAIKERAHALATEFRRAAALFSS